MTERQCVECGKPIVRKRRLAKDGRYYLERPKSFASRKYCDKICEGDYRRQHRWNDDAVDELIRLDGLDLTAADVAKEMRRGGFGEWTRNAILGKLNRLIQSGALKRSKPEPVVMPAPAPPPPRLRPPGPGGCMVHGCRLTRQPGRDYCARHHAELVVAKIPRRAGSESLFVGSGGSSLVG